jgi:hypothetical protein
VRNVAPLADQSRYAFASARMTGVPVTDDLGAEHRLVEVPGPVLVGDHQELRDEQLAGWRCSVVHSLSP